MGSCTSINSKVVKPRDIKSDLKKEHNSKKLGVRDFKGFRRSDHIETSYEILGKIGRGN